MEPLKILAVANGDSYVCDILVKMPLEALKG